MSYDFTEERYGEILDLAASRFTFRTFSQNLEGTDIALWRHDIDFSPNRAFRLANIEAERGLTATYFVQLTSRFYNIFEPEIVRMIREISLLGHEIGLHFEPKADKEPDHEKQLLFEIRCLSECVELDVCSFSLHNPSTYDNAYFYSMECAGLINATSPILREMFTYCSDSNGIWRFRPLDEVLKDPDTLKIYVLTHPEWWQPVVMHARDRIVRCVEGRAHAALQYYDDLLSQNQRPNERIS